MFIQLIACVVMKKSVSNDCCQTGFDVSTDPSRDLISLILFSLLYFHGLSMVEKLLQVNKISIEIELVPMANNEVNYTI